MIQYALTVANWAYRGSDFIFPIIVYNEDGTLATLNATSKYHLKMFTDSISTTPVVEMEETSIYKGLSLIVFTFAPEDTAELLARGYIIQIFEETSAGKFYPLLSTSFGLIPFNGIEIPEEV